MPRNDSPGDPAMECLVDLIAGFGNSSGQNIRPGGLLLEHLQAARRYRLGAMQSEYNVSLQLAEESLGCIPDASLRTRTKDILTRLMKSNTRLVSPAA